MQDAILFSYLVTQLPGLPVGQLILVVNFKTSSQLSDEKLVATVNQPDIISSTG